MLEGCSQYCVTFVRIVSSVPYWHIITGPAVHEDNESFQFQNYILRYVYCTWQWQGDTTACDLWQCKPGLPCWFLSTVDEVWCYVAAGEFTKKNPIIWPFEDIVHRQYHGSGCIWNIYQFRMLSRVSSMFGKPWKWAVASTTTYVPTVLIITDLNPQFMAYLTWRSIQVSASSCQHAWLKFVCVLTISRANDTIQ